MNEIIVYKVLRTKNGVEGLFSAFTWNKKLEIEYKLGVVNAPIIESSYIFVYNSYDNAKMYNNPLYFSSLRIYKAKTSAVYNPSPVILNPICFSIPLIEDFWKSPTINPSFPIHYINPPEGTLFCKDLTLIEEMK